MVTGTNPETLDAAQKELGSDVRAVASDAADLEAQRALAHPVGQKVNTNAMARISQLVLEGFVQISEWD